MDQSLIRSVSKEIYRRFPEFDGVRPTVKSQSAAGRKDEAPSYVLTFKTSAKLPGSKTLSRSVRVTVSAQGKILKVSTSR